LVNVAILIVTWNKRIFVCRLLDLLEKLDLPEIQTDIFLVDNCSTDNTASYITEYYPHITLFQTDSNIGGSGGFSHGLSHISRLNYDYIWLLDDDVTVAEDSLLHLVRILEKYPDIGAAGSQIRQLDNPEVINEIGGFFNATKGEAILNFHNAPAGIHDQISRLYEYQTVDYCAAASFLVRTPVVKQLGGFKNYFLHFDDIEWCLRMWKEGWKVVAVPKSIIWHIGQQGKTRSWIRYYGTRNAMYLMTEVADNPIPLIRYLGKTTITSIYNAIMGRAFLSKIYYMAVRDFLHNIEGKLPYDLPYQVISFSELSSQIKLCDCNIVLAPSVNSKINNAKTFNEIFGDWSFVQEIPSDRELFLIYENNQFHTKVKYSGGESNSVQKDTHDRPMTTWYKSEIQPQTDHNKLIPLDVNRIFHPWKMHRNKWIRYLQCFYYFFNKKFDIAITSLKNPEPSASFIAKKTCYLIENGVIEAKHSPISLISNLIQLCAQWVSLFPSVMLKLFKNDRR